MSSWDVRNLNLIINNINHNFKAHGVLIATGYARLDPGIKKKKKKWKTGEKNKACSLVNSKVSLLNS